MGYYVDAYVPVLAKASIAASQKGVPNEQRVSYSSSASASTGWSLNDTPSVGRSAMHIMPPLINRGYYARVAAIRASIKTFLSTLNGAQVVSLGAGFDSTYFVLKVRRQDATIHLDVSPVDTLFQFEVVSSLQPSNSTGLSYSCRMKDSISQNISRLMYLIQY